MKLSPPKRQREYPVAPEALANARAVIFRLTGIRVDPSHIQNLDLNERHELVSLTSKIGRDESGQPAGTNLNRLSPKERRRWEALIEGATLNPGHFQHQREQADTNATLEALARKSRTPHRESWQPPVGAVVLLSEDLLSHLDRPDPALWLSDLGVLVFLLVQLENGIALSPGARFEGAGDELALVLDRRLGLGVRFDPEGELGGWEKRLKHLARNSWLLIEDRGPEVRVRRGKRTLRAVKESK
jgi:hypothetical protein